jgi:PBSX family phage terminase large subunit
LASTQTTPRGAAIDIQLPIVYGNNRRAYLCHDPEVVLSGPADTGKTIALLTKLHWLAHKHAGASIVIARKQLTDTYSTVLITLQKKIIAQELEAGVVQKYGGDKPQWFDYPNGSRIWVAGLDHPGKVLSAEHDVAYVNQAEELALADWETLTTRTTGRAGHMPYPQVIGDCNPSGPTHWIRQRAKAGLLTMINSTHHDNPELYDQETGEITPEGERRIGALRRLTGSRRARLYEGLWVSPEGAIFEVFDETTNQIGATPIPRLWPRFVGIDPIGAYVAAVWLAFDATSNVLHVYREYLEPFGIPTRDHAQNILELSGYRRNGAATEAAEPIYFWVCGQPAERQARLDWQAAGLPVVGPAFSDVWSGLDMIIELLSLRQLVIHDSCPHLLGEIADYRRKVDKRSGEVTDKIENKEAYHLIDSLRYAIVGPEPQETSEVIALPWATIG